MGINTPIQWTDNSHNFWEGCNKIDTDCKNCYAERMFARFGKDFATIRKIKNFDAPLKWGEPKKIFTCSTSDFFHIQADEWRNEAWDIIRKCPQHIFQILTKRPERISANLPEYWDEIKDRCWMGTSVGSQQGIQRMIDLATVDNLGIKFLSLEPLHGEIDLSAATIYVESVEDDFYVLPAFDWVIVGGESGNETGKYRYRPCELAWIEKIVNDCKKYSKPVFVKQMGTWLSKELKMSDRHGSNIDEFPASLQVREFPIICKK